MYNQECVHYGGQFCALEHLSPIDIAPRALIILPLYAIYWSYKHMQFARNNKSQLFQVPKSTIFCQFALLLVGCGSWMFHMTLLYPMQLLDELPMLYCAGLMIYANFDLILEVKKFEEENISEKPIKTKSVLMK